MRFGLELCSLAALGYWGFHAGNSTAADWLLGLGTPIVFALIWGLFFSPKAVHRLKDPMRLCLEAVLFAWVAVALADSSSPELAIAFAVAITANLTLLVLLGQRSSV